jgi:sodium transport system permease protein
LFELGAEAPWHLWVPGLAQSSLMLRVLKGDALTDAGVWVSSSLACLVITGLALLSVARALRRAALK